MQNITRSRPFLFTLLFKPNYNVRTTLPLSCHLVGSRSGRKDRLNGGFFNLGIKERRVSIFDNRVVQTACDIFKKRVSLLVTTPATPLIKAYQCGFFYA
jgi:hypothetical protein